MKFKITKMVIICIFTVVLSLIFICIASSLIYFNFKTIFILAFFCTITLSAIFIIEKIKAEKDSFGKNIIDQLNFNKKLIEYNTLLEQVIKSANINICVENKSGKRIFCSGLFKENILQTGFLNKSDIKIEDKIYKIRNCKIQSSNFQEELSLTILENITEYLVAQENKETSMATIAHDLKTPIFAISQALELIRLGRFGELNPTQKEILELCRNSGCFAKYLVGNILCSYKISHNGIKLNIESFNLCKTIEDCKNEICFIFKEKPININLNIPKTYTLQGDKNEIKRVVLNLLYNAVTYSKPDSDIDINLNFDETHVHFSITNESEYISGKDLDAIFKKNFSLNNKYNKPGTGLGLYVSKQIIQAHGGQMIVKSSASNINIFGFSLKHNNIISAQNRIV